MIDKLRNIFKFRLYEKSLSRDVYGLKNPRVSTSPHNKLREYYFKFPSMSFENKNTTYVICS